MEERPEDSRQVPAYVALVRILAVVGMSAALAFGLFLAVGGFWTAGLVAAAVAIPFFIVMRLVERLAEPPDMPPQ